MACSSIVSLLRSCGQRITPGTDEYYFIRFGDLSANTSTRLVYSADTQDTIQAIYKNSGTTFVQVQGLKDTAGLTETGTIDQTKGVNYLTQTWKLSINYQSAADKTFIESVRDQPIVVLYKNRSGVYFATGVEGNLMLKTLEGGSGTDLSSSAAYALSFEGTSTSTVRLVNTSIVTGLIS